MWLLNPKADIYTFKIVYLLFKFDNLFSHFEFLKLVILICKELRSKAEEMKTLHTFLDPVVYLQIEIKHT